MIVEKFSYTIYRIGVLVIHIMVAQYDVHGYLTFVQFFDEIFSYEFKSFKINIFSSIHQITKMNQFFYVVGVHVRKKYIFKKTIKILSKYLRIVLEPKMRIIYEWNQHNYIK
jgi:hypothetical protein